MKNVLYIPEIPLFEGLDEKAADASVEEIRKSAKRFAIRYRSLLSELQSDFSGGPIVIHPKDSISGSETAQALVRLITAAIPEAQINLGKATSIGPVGMLDRKDVDELLRDCAQGIVYSNHCTCGECLPWSGKFRDSLGAKNVDYLGGYLDGFVRIELPSEKDELVKYMGKTK